LIHLARPHFSAAITSFISCLHFPVHQPQVRLGPSHSGPVFFGSPGLGSGAALANDISRLGGKLSGMDHAIRRRRAVLEPPRIYARACRTRRLPSFGCSYTGRNKTSVPPCSYICQQYTTSVFVGPTIEATVFRYVAKTATVYHTQCRLCGQPARKSAFGRIILLLGVKTKKTQTR